MKKITLLVSCLLILGSAHAQVICIFCNDSNAPISSPVVNLIQNGGFELGCVNNDYFCPGSNSFSCFLSFWQCYGGGPLTYARIVNSSFSVIPEGFLAAYLGNFESKACSPIQYDTLCLTTNGCETTGIPSGYPSSNAGYGADTGVSIEQNVSGLIPGNMYVLEFWAGGEWDSGTFTRPGVFAVDVGFGKIFLRDKVTEPSTGVGTRYLVIFSATLPSHLIKFTNWGHVCGSCTELVLDDVRLYTYAELSPLVPPCITGLDNDSEKNSHTTTEIYPNPATNELVVSGLEFAGKSEIEIYNVLGEKIYSQQETSNQQPITVNVSQLPSGIYFVKIKTEKEERVGKFVKE